MRSARLQVDTEASTKQKIRPLILALRDRITITAFHLLGECNVVADVLSRQNQVFKNELCLNASTYSCMQTRSMFGLATVDLFEN